jgi:phytoene desaturase
MARSGWQVTLLEKNSTLGGRIQYRYRDGFKFNLGPTMYLMPEVFEEFFKDFGIDINDKLKFQEVHPYFRVFGIGAVYDLSDTSNTKSLLEQDQKGSGRQFKKMMNRSRQQYANLRLHYFNSSWSGLFDIDSLSEIMNIKSIKIGDKFNNFINRYIVNSDIKSFYNYIAGVFDDRPEKMAGIMHALPYILTGQQLNSLKGGMDKLTISLTELAQSLGVYISVNSEVTKIESKFKQVTGVKLKNGSRIDCDAVIAGVDYAYAETRMLDPGDMSYSASYWSNKHYGPSLLIITTALNQKLSKLKVHNFFTSSNSEDRSFYVYASSRIDSSDAPSGYDNLVIQVRLNADEGENISKLNLIKQRIYDRISKECEKDMGQLLIFDEMRAESYFEDTFHATRGSCYGISPRIKQIGPFGPKIKSKVVEGLFYTGQDTIAGSSMALALNSGKLSAYLLLGK